MLGITTTSFCFPSLQEPPHRGASSRGRLSLVLLSRWVVDRALETSWANQRGWHRAWGATPVPYVGSPSGWRRLAWYRGNDRGGTTRPFPVPSSAPDCRD